MSGILYLCSTRSRILINSLVIPADPLLYQEHPPPQIILMKYMCKDMIFPQYRCSVFVCVGGVHLCRCTIETMPTFMWLHSSFRICSKTSEALMTCQTCCFLKCSVVFVLPMKSGSVCQDRSQRTPRNSVVSVQNYLNKVNMNYAFYVFDAFVTDSGHSCG